MAATQPWLLLCRRGRQQVEEALSETGPLQAGAPVRCSPALRSLLSSNGQPWRAAGRVEVQQR